MEYNIKVIVESSINEPPYFEDELEANIQINKTSQAEIWEYDLPKIVDPDDQNVVLTLNLDEVEDFITFDEI